MTDSAAPKPDWIPTTIEDIEARIARGEWPRVRAIMDKAGPTQIMQGRIIAGQGPSSDPCSAMLREPGLDNEPVDLASRSLWIWAVPEPEPLAATEGMLEALDDLTEMRAGIADEWTEHVARWSEPMAAKLRANAHKSGWLHDAPKVLLDRVYGELDEVGQALSKVIRAAREGSHVQSFVADLRREAADVANMVMMVADAVEEQGAGLRAWRIPEVRRRSEPVRIAIGPYLVHEQRGPDGTSGLTIRKNNEAGSEPVFEIEASGTGNWRHSAYLSRLEPDSAEININATVEFTLTERGAKTWNLLGRSPVRHGAPMKAPLWEVMQVLGPATTMGFEQPHLEHNAFRVDLGSDCVSLTGGSPFVSGKINGSPVAAKPSHRAVTLTTETLELARGVARSVIRWPDPGQPDAHSRACALMDRLAHAEGMPAADLRKLCKWAREQSKVRSLTADIMEIIDRVLLHLAIDEMPVGSVDARGSADSEVAAARVVQALGIKLETASLRRLAHGQGSLREDLVMPVLDEVDRLRAELRLAKPVELRTKIVRKLGLPDGTSISEVADAVDRALAESNAAKAALIRIDRFVRGLDETEVYTFDDPGADGIITRIAQRRARSGDLRIAHQLGVLLDLPSSSPGSAFVGAVERLVERAEEQAHMIEGAKAKLSEVESLDRLGAWLRKNMGEHFAVEGIADTAIRRLAVSASFARKLAIAMLVDQNTDAVGILSMAAQWVGVAQHARAEVAQRDEWIRDIAECLGLDRHRVRYQEVIDAAAEAAGVALPLTTALRRIDAVLRGNDPAEVSEATVIMSAEAADELAVRVAVLQQRVRAPQWLTEEVEIGRFVVSRPDFQDGSIALVVEERDEDGHRDRIFGIVKSGGELVGRNYRVSELALDLSAALIKIDAISRGDDSDRRTQSPVSKMFACTLASRIREQFDGFRQLAERTMTATASLAALEALIHRGFDRLREVDPEFVESLRKGGS
jgi:NTP pyrophosphatase (non-canonical NTP hydrolase)